MVTLQLTSHYFGFCLKIRIEDSKAENLLNSAPVSKVDEDIDRFTYGYAPVYLTPSQCRRIKNFFGSNNDYFDKIEKLN